MTSYKMIFPAAAVAVMLAAGTACRDDSGMRRAEAHTETDWRAERAEARKAVNTRLDAAERRLDEMGESLDKLGNKAKKESREAMAKLREEARDARAASERLGDSTEKTWRETKRDLDNAADKLEAHVKSAWDSLTN